jgi:hypothetical protein
MFYYIVSKENIEYSWYHDEKQNRITLHDRNRTKFKIENVSLDGGNAQIVKFKKFGGDKYVDVWGTPAYFNRANLIMDTRNQNNNQKFFIKPCDGGGVMISPVLNPNLVLDIFEPKNPTLYWVNKTSNDCNPNKIWKLVKAKKFHYEKNKKISQGAPTEANTNATKLYNTYHMGYEFPLWSLAHFAKRYMEYAPTVQVYYPDCHSRDVVERLLIEREPVNITMNRYYDQSALCSHFNWQHGRYETFFNEHKTLCPNIGVFCKTPVKLPNDVFIDVNIFNAVGYAFDIENQPDYKYFIVGQKQSKLQTNYQELFHRIYTCAVENKLDTIILSLVGANNFANKYEDGNGGEGKEVFQSTVWAPALLATMKNFVKIKTKIMGSNDDTAWRLKGTDLEKMEDCGFFPHQNAQLMTPVQRSQTLFVNAWDPLSIVGNGNKKDPSLDGRMGKVTMMALLCWPFTNHQMKYKPV